MATSTKTLIDVKKASTKALVDFGGSAEALAKRNGLLVTQIKEELRERCGNLPPDEGTTEVGDDYVAAIGKVPQRVNVKELDNHEIISMIGQEAFNTLAKFPIGMLREYLSKNDFDKLCTPEPGTRTVSFKERSREG